MGCTGLSRYESDFQELRSLGKGGYGVVVSAINRLDGRQYAVKKIKMQSQSPQGFSRLIREVTTLSRLQHPHVVRYFQVKALSCCKSASSCLILLVCSLNIPCVELWDMSMWVQTGKCASTLTAGMV